MLKITSILFCLFYLSLCSAQSLPDKFKLKGMMIIYKDNDGDYLYHKDWKPVDYLAVFDPENKKLKIYTSSDALDGDFDIIRAEKMQKTDNGDIVFKLKVIDKKGRECAASFITLKNENEGFQSFIKIDYGNIAMVYRYKDE